ncbi:molybdate ABC transporter substrate-binding protein [Neoroseomonas rubea]|uniref:molybdate ABC transporter substrate-binding protein n=1 Tax=Neoroseomonas rubea TaxID=2748666 RepID=UPI0018DFB9DE|nr:substrate-binding domain-containing protein [Roseomonas rubea]
MSRARDHDGLRIFVPVAIHALFVRLAPRLEAAAGRALAPTIDLNPAIAQRILAGEPYDIALTNPHHVADLVAAGIVDGATHRPFGRTRLAIARRALGDGSILTDVSDIAALLLAAESIAYTGAGTSGPTFLAAMARLGLSDAVAPKGRPMAGVRPVVAVAAGEAELAVGPLSAIISSPGVAVAAIFPDAVGSNIDISAFLPPMHAAGAAEALDVLTDTALDAQLASFGIERAGPSWGV